MTLPAADFTSKHIQGYARAAIEAGKDGYFKVPLISHIVDNLWVGGCINGVKLADDFRFVVSLYPWEQYQLGPDTQRFEIEMYDAADMPDRQVLHETAELVNRCVEQGKTLVHCQAGLNRSNLVAALSMIKQGVAPDAAIALLRARRCDVVLCNETFERWLLTLA